MITCERFEREFEAWKNDKLPSEEDEQFNKHVAECSHCSSFELSHFRLRDLTSSLPSVEPSASFEYRLNSRINELDDSGVRGYKRERKLLPRWAALGAGLATGIAVGLIIVLTPGTEDMTDPGNHQTASVAMHETVDGELEDSSDIDRDSIEIPESLYEIDRHSQTVSGR
ncbi:hypothetical protein HQ587_08365 [bacterium]|nr:hypothetical protein [bacterium]